MFIWTINFTGNKMNIEFDYLEIKVSFVFQYTILSSYSHRIKPQNKDCLWFILSLGLNLIFSDQWNFFVSQKSFYSTYRMTSNDVIK